MANKPAAWSQEKWEAHVAASQLEASKRAAVEANPVAAILELRDRVAALEGKPAEAPKAAKKARR